MYFARFARFHLQRAVGGLTPPISKWTHERDLRLVRLIMYIHNTWSHRQIGSFGDDWSCLRLGLFTDADFITSGMFLYLYGPNSFFPLAGQSKKQTAVSLSTSEGE